MSVAAHPRAADAVRRAKGAGGLIGLVLSAALARHAGLPAFDAGLRALIGGIAGYVVFWTVAVQAARHLVLAEARAAGRAHAERGSGLAAERREREERLAAAAAAALHGLAADRAEHQRGFLAGDLIENLAAAFESVELAS
jgi:hypothetical protein